jgi:hypothetical protein
MQKKVCNTGQNYNIRLNNVSFENVAKVKYSGTTIQIEMMFIIKSKK